MTTAAQPKIILLFMIGLNFQKVKRLFLAESAAATRMRDLKAAISSITKNYGDGSITRLGDSYKVKIDVIPTGALALDMALSVCGSRAAALWKFTIGIDIQSNGNPNLAEVAFANRGIRGIFCAAQSGQEQAGCAGEAERRLNTRIKARRASSKNV